MIDPIMIRCNNQSSRGTGRWFSNCDDCRKEHITSISPLAWREIVGNTFYSQAANQIADEY